MLHQAQLLGMMASFPLQDLMDAGSLETWSAGMTVAEYPAAGQPIAMTRPTVVGFVGRARRGPVNEAVAISSLAEYQRIFGTPTASSWLSHAVTQFFEHGGQHARVVRVINRGACATLHMPAGEGRIILRARDPGRHEHLRISVDHDRVEPEPLRFNLVVQRLSDTEPRRVVDQEIYRRLTVQPGSEDYLGDALMGSSLVRLAGPCPLQRPDRTVSSSAGAAVSYIDLRADGHDGDDLCDYDLVGSATDCTGLFALNACDELSLLCLPPPAPNRDLGLTTLVAAERFCRQRGVMLVFDPPRAWSSARIAMKEAAELGLASGNAMTYYPRLQRRGDTAERLLPACGAIAGMLARKDATAGLWRALDSQTGLLRGSLAPAEDVPPEMAQKLRRLGINVFSRAAGGACVLRGDATLAGSSASAHEWQSLTQRRLALHVLDSVSRATRWLVFEQNDPVLWARVRRQASMFLQELHEQGAFAGHTPEQSWFVKCDADTVVQDRHGAPQLNIVLGIALSRPSEFLIFNIAHRLGSTRISSMPLTRSLSLAG
ncbi:MAG: phage tail sheath subtilisin-like domain-containing protein [Gammaproteobacteria bacterium]|nr:phage tail sheath subtilisin-like domain-containing protein [Gammaproteobacteria bacterium]